MRKFRLGENNIIVALSSLEELKDIPDCNVVIRFDVPNNYRSYIQSKVSRSIEFSLRIGLICLNIHRAKHVLKHRISLCLLKKTNMIRF